MKEIGEMITVKMLSTTYGSPDGKKVEVYKVAKTYNIPEKLFEAFRDMGVIELPKEEAVQEPVIETAVEEEPTEQAVEKPKRRGRPKKKDD